MKIGEVATATALTVDTIRYYERRGVISEPARLESGYRNYEPGVIDRLRTARQLQELGLTLDEIIETLRSHDQGTATCENERWRLVVVLDRIDRQIAELATLRTSIDQAQTRCSEGRCDLLGTPSKPSIKA